MSGLDSLLHRRPPTVWERFCDSPLLFLARTAYSFSSNPSTALSVTAQDISASCIRIVCISDTHNTHRHQPVLPDGDILIHAGDLTQSGTPAELADALAWLDEQPHQHKLLIAGNHDCALADPAARTRILAAYPALVYLQDQATTVAVRGRELRVYGSPRTPQHGGGAFHYPRAAPAVLGLAPAEGEHDVEDVDLTAASSAVDVWARIPALTDVLVTHGPPLAHRELDARVGCAALLAALWRVRPRLHVFGHVHAGRGVERARWGAAQRAYDEICAGSGIGGWFALARLLVWVVVERIGAWWGFLDGDEGTVMVNAAAVGGTRDERKEGAVVVCI
ncbi:metallophosphoesterase domain-containing protein 1 [Epithele typhae]|uniref:metallophosphoesterase domain-containing protein 1 n=1 Tax=Epithele typhae TaxID=378194 RepID=UPI0020074FA1|nr:metallophosphoesterase domain-containing protein 1 [Epithele typhae]KAH9941871.1 metallophosphoesterase domain-containing protein 1 [Epithele typhae]